MQAGASTSAPQQVPGPANGNALNSTATANNDSPPAQPLTLPPPPTRRVSSSCLPVESSTYTQSRHPTELARDVLVRAITNSAAVQSFEFTGALTTLLNATNPAPRKVDQLLIGVLRMCIELKRGPLLRLYVSTIVSTLAGDDHAPRRHALLAGLASPVPPESWQPFGVPTRPGRYMGPPLLGRLGSVGREWRRPLDVDENDCATGLNAYLCAILASPHISDMEAGAVLASDFTTMSRTEERSGGGRHHALPLTAASQALSHGHVELVVSTLHAIFESERPMHSKEALVSRLSIDWPTLLLRLETLRASRQQEWSDEALPHIESALKELARDLPPEAPEALRFGARPVTHSPQQNLDECRVKLDSGNPRVLAEHNRTAASLDEVCKNAKLTAFDFVIAVDGTLKMLCRSRIYIKSLDDSLVPTRFLGGWPVDESCCYYAIPLSELRLR